MCISGCNFQVFQINSWLFSIFGLWIPFSLLLKWAYLSEFIHWSSLSPPPARPSARTVIARSSAYLSIVDCPFGCSLTGQVRASNHVEFISLSPYFISYLFGTPVPQVRLYDVNYILGYASSLVCLVIMAHFTELMAFQISSVMSATHLFKVIQSSSLTNTAIGHK